MILSATVVGYYDSIEFMMVPPWLAFQIDVTGTGNGRSFYLAMAGASSFFSIKPEAPNP